MSGIAGVVAGVGGRLQRTDLAHQVSRMLQCVDYRGPDGMQIWIRDGVGLGHASLVTTAEDRLGAQPLVSPLTGCVITADARLDNRSELLSQLGWPAGGNICDAELILRAYEHWGLDAPKRLTGDFAFAIWDPRRARLVCARDTYGQRPLHYRSNDGGGCSVASEIHQLLQDPSVPLAPDENRILDDLVPASMLRNQADRADTYYAGISALTAGSMLVATAETVRIQRYWEFVPGPELRYRRESDYVDHFRALLTDAVRNRLRSDSAVGALLSGGLDSSSLVCLAQELYRSGDVRDNGFATFSAVYPGLECDEQPLIEEVQRKYGFSAHLVTPDADNEWSLATPRGFCPRPGLAVAGLDALFSASVDAGVRVLLTGEIADACVRGSALVFDSLIRHGRLLEAARQMKRYLQESDESARSVLALYLMAPLLTLPLQRLVMTAFADRYARKNSWRLLPEWIGAPVDETLRTRHRDLLIAREKARRFSNPTLHWEHLALYPAEEAPLSLGWPIEIRRPFADPRLHAFLLAVPPELKFVPHLEVAGSYAGGKRLLREAMRGILPEPIRGKTGITAFNSAISEQIDRHWSRYVETFGPGVHPRVAERGYVDGDRFWARLQAFREGGAAAMRRDARLLMYVVGLEQWLRALELPRSAAVKVATPWKGRVANIRAEAREPGSPTRPTAAEEQVADCQFQLQLEVKA